MPNIDALAEQHYADRDPQFAREEEFTVAAVYEGICGIYDELEASINALSELISWERSIRADCKRLNIASDHINDALEQLGEEMGILEDGLFDQ